MADLITVETSREGALTGSTHKNHAWLWCQFTKYLGTICIGQDVFLDSFTRSQQNKIIGTFAMALQEGRFSSAAHDTLALGTIQNTISDISATFRENGRPDPTMDNDRQLSFILQCQFRAYKNADPKEHQQKAIPACVIAKIAKQKLTEPSVQSCNSPSLPSFLPCVHASRSRLSNRKNDEPKSSTSKIFDSSKMDCFADCINITSEL
jgi:hypothetical protein